jgi:protein TonB
MDSSGFSVPGLNLAEGVANVQAHEGPVEFINAKDYFEMLHLRIYSFKRYPESARANHIEGRVKVQFVLSADGTLTDIKILKSSRHKRLDEAAIDAIQRSAPFPRPPSFIFKTPVTLRIDILFELA